MQSFDTIIIGAGAAGLMCAIEAGKRGRQVLVIDHAKKIGEKIRISGGGRCNFTNLGCAPDKYISQNPNFCKSALRRYTQHDFIALIERHKIAYHEKTLGQLFCDNSANDIIQMLLDECAAVKARIMSGTSVETVTYDAADNAADAQYICATSNGIFSAASLVVACGGLSIPKIGASPFGFKLAEQFGHTIVPPRAGLVPLTFDPVILNQTKALSGIAVNPARVASQSKMHFDEAILFTHRGISGPAILQISSYWEPGQDIIINLAPEIDMLAWLKTQKQTQGKRAIHTVLEAHFAQKLTAVILEELKLQGRIGDMPGNSLTLLANRLQQWRIKPSGSEGYRTAEVTLGGVSTNEISSKTFESKLQPNLFFIGEVVDVTGHLGGYNFQWAWSSGWCAGQYA